MGFDPARCRLRSAVLGSVQFCRAEQRHWFVIGRVVVRGASRGVRTAPVTVCGAWVPLIAVVRIAAGLGLVRATCRGPLNWDGGTGIARSQLPVVVAFGPNTARRYPYGHGRHPFLGKVLRVTSSSLSTLRTQPAWGRCPCDEPGAGDTCSPPEVLLPRFDPRHPGTYSVPRGVCDCSVVLSVTAIIDAVPGAPVHVRRRNQCPQWMIRRNGNSRTC